MSAVQALDEENQQPVTHQFLRRLAGDCEYKHFFDNSVSARTKCRCSHYFVMAFYLGKMPTPREVLKDYLPVVFDLVKTTSLVVIAASGIHLGYHVHEMTHEGVIWRDPPADIDHSGHRH